MKTEKVHLQTCAHMRTIFTSVLSQQQTPILSQQQLPILSQQRSSALSQQKIPVLSQRQISWKAQHSFATLFYSKHVQFVICAVMPAVSGGAWQNGGRDMKQSPAHTRWPELWLFNKLPHMNQAPGCAAASRLRSKLHRAKT